MLLAAITIYLGFFRGNHDHYLIVCILLVLYTMIPFFVNFERSRPKARELVIIAVLIATAVVGRAAFFMIPSFKPILAIVIIAGVSLGKNSGFLVGAMSAFVSNFLFGQGPWTPWQMIAMALVGYLAGLLFHHSIMGNSDGRDTSSEITGAQLVLLVVFGAVSVFVLYGGIVDIWTILAITPQPTLATVITVYGAAVYFNLVHAGATVIFLLLLAKPMIAKLNRVRRKYGMEAFA